jgi:acyl-CoA thioesterase FadM
MARMAATARLRGPCRFGEGNRFSFRCLPTDIDSYGHMNNARYAMLADIGRIDLFIRSGMMRLGRKKNWWPLMGGNQTVYNREIRLWQAFDVVSVFDLWQDRQLIGRHEFILAGGRVAALTLTTVGIYDYGGANFVPIEAAMRAIGQSETSRRPDEVEALFLASHRRIRGEANAAVRN